MQAREPKRAGILDDFDSQRADVTQSRKLPENKSVRDVYTIQAHRFIVARLSYVGIALLLGWAAPTRMWTEPVQATPTLYTISLVPTGQIACALNAVGQIAGITNYAAGTETRPVIWTQDNPTSAITAPVTEDEFCSVGAINDAGQIVGGFNSDVALIPFVWSPGGFQQVPLPSGATAGEASGINQTGDIVGNSSGDTGTRGFVWRVGTDVQELAPLPGDTFSNARSINDSGQAAGTSANDNGRHAVLWSSSGVVQDLGTLPGDTSSEATAINTGGDVVGYSEGPEGTRAFLWTSQTGMQDLGQLTNSTDCHGLAINDSGVVAGTCVVSGESHAFVWTAQGGMQDLNQLVLWTPQGDPSFAHPLPPSGILPIVLVGAHAINNKGQIIATAVDAKPPCLDESLDESGLCPMADCAPVPKYFFVLTLATAQ
jgi:probable HAF family extracellular repeat protein